MPSWPQAEYSPLPPIFPRAASTARIAHLHRIAYDSVRRHAPVWDGPATTEQGARRPGSCEHQSRGHMADIDDEYIRMRGKVKKVLRSATFLVEIEGGLEVTARPSGRMRRGRMIRILPGDEVDVEVSTYDPTKGRIVWRYR